MRIHQDAMCMYTLINSKTANKYWPSLADRTSDFAVVGRYIIYTCFVIIKPDRPLAHTVCDESR